MDPFKKQLDEMMGDTRLQESRIKQRVKSELTPTPENRNVRGMFN